jgi:hypothetical protein
MSFIDWATLVAGIIGLLSITVGAGMIFLPAGFIVLVLHRCPRHGARWHQGITDVRQTVF